MGNNVMGPSHTQSSQSKVGPPPVQSILGPPVQSPPLSISIGDKIYQLGRPPSSQQWAFLRAAEKEQLYGGAKRGGKSFAECLKLILLAVSFPGNRLGLFRQDLTDLRDSTLNTFFRICPPELILNHHKTHHIIYIRTNSAPSEIVYGGLGDEHEVESAKGKEFGAIAIDEPSEIDLDTYIMLMAQLCWVLPDGTRPPYMMILGCNPEPGWVDERFRSLIDVASKSNPIVSNKSQIFVRALPQDNPYLPPNWEDELRSTVKNKVWVDKYLGGSWDVFEGQLFKEFDERIHVITLGQLVEAELLPRLKLIASIDHASTGVTCMAIDGYDEVGNVFALGSYYERNMLISQHAAGMKVLMDKWAALCNKGNLVAASTHTGMHPSVAAFEYILIDPSTQAKTLQNRTELASVQSEYARYGIPTSAAWNAVETGWDLMRDYITIKPTHLHPITKLRGAPSWFVVRDGNRDGLKEIAKYKRTVDVHGRIKYVGFDHWLDNQRYILMSRPELPKFTSADVVSMDTHAQKAFRSMEKWSKNFGQSPNKDQWFPMQPGRAN